MERQVLSLPRSPWERPSVKLRLARTGILNLFPLLQTSPMRTGSFAERPAQAELGHEELGSKNVDDTSQIALDRSKGQYGQMEYVCNQNQESGVRTQKSGVRDQNSGRKPEITPPHSMSGGAVDENRRCKPEYPKQLRQTHPPLKCLSSGAVDGGQISPPHTRSIGPPDGICRCKHLYSKEL
jgi:hypothetical protein